MIKEVSGCLDITGKFCKTREEAVVMSLGHHMARVTRFSNFTEKKKILTTYKDDIMELLKEL